jgi:hypothetical protein
MSAITDLQPPKLQNKLAAKWKRKLANQSGILDTGFTSGAGAKHDADCFHDTGLPSEKIFMLPYKTKIKVTNKMQLKYNLWPQASKINIVPNLHSMLISVPKMADADYIVIFNKNEARICNATTTIVSASTEPLLVSQHYQDTGLWKLDLDYKVLGQEYPKQFIAGIDRASTIFNLPNNQHSLIYHYALVGFPTKEMFLAAVWAGN